MRDKVRQNGSSVEVFMEIERQKTADVQPGSGTACGSIIESLSSDKLRGGLVLPSRLLFFTHPPVFWINMAKTALSGIC